MILNTQDRELYCRRGIRPIFRTWRCRPACLFQFFVAEGKLSCQLYQRSADCLSRGAIQYRLYALRRTWCDCADLRGEFVHTLGDAHLYANHFDQAHEQLTQAPGAAQLVITASRTALMISPMKISKSPTCTAACAAPITI